MAVRPVKLAAMNRLDEKDNKQEKVLTLPLGSEMLHNQKNMEIILRHRHSWNDNT